MPFSLPLEQDLIDSADEFRDSIEALYELVTLVDESSGELDNLPASINRRLLLTDPSLTDPEGLLSAIDDAATRALKRREEEASRREKVEDGADDDDDDEGISIDFSDVAAKYGEHIVPIALRILMRSRRRRATVAFNSLLVAAVGEFEALCAKCIRSFLSRYPATLSGSERSFTFAEIAAFDDLDAFRSSAADQYAENLMRGSVDAWLKWFTTNVKLAPEDIAVDWDVFVEIFQRRHLLVHNGGVVNHIYRSKVKKLPPDVSAQPKDLTARVDVGREYLQDAIAQLNAAGLLLAIRTSLKLKKPTAMERHPAAGLIGDASYEFLRDGRQRELEIFSERVLAHCPEESIRLLVQVNLWTERKQAGGVAAISGEVSQWDVAHCSERFKIAKLALLDRHEEVWRLAQRMIAGGELFEYEWATWPLLAETRSWLGSKTDNLEEVGTPPDAAGGDENDGSSVETPGV